MRFFMWVTLFVVYGASFARAQVINIENVRMQTDTTGWKGELGGNFSLVNNGAKLWLVGADAHVQYKTEKDLWLGLLNYGLQKSASQKFSDQTLLHLRYNRKLTKALRWEVFTQWQNNAVNNIKSRFLVGTGPRLKIAGNAIIRLYAATAFMYEYEEESGLLKITHHDVRSSSYLSFTITPAANTELSATTYYQPLLKGVSDYRFLTQARIRVKAGKKFSVQIRWNYLHDSAPAGNSPKEVYTFSTGLGYDF
jgi:hypothetical protein